MKKIAPLFVTLFISSCSHAPGPASPKRDLGQDEREFSKNFDEIENLDFESILHPKRGQRYPAEAPLGRSGEDVLREVIYGSKKWTKVLKVLGPFLPKVAIDQVDKYVAKLDLDPTVKARVRSRINSQDFMDKVVPFVVMLKDHYLAPKQRSGFEEEIRRSPLLSQNIPGLEHTMFKLKNEAASGTPAEGSGFKLDPKLAAQVVTLYDALFLKEGGNTLGNVPTDPADNPQAVKELVPHARKLLTLLKDTFEEGSDQHTAINAIVGNDERLETLTLSLAKFLKDVVYRHYTMFLQRAGRAYALDTYLKAKINEAFKGKDDLWVALETANQKRRYGVHLVVDGLQGTLAEALSYPRSDSGQVFWKQIKKDHDAASSISTGAQTSYPGPEQKTSFADFLATANWDDAHFMPNFKRIFKENLRTIARAGVSSTPTISVRNLPIVMTGAAQAGPNSIGLPNFHYVDRHDKSGNGRAYYFYGNDAVLIDDITKKNGLISVFMRLPNYTTMSCNTQHDRESQFFYDGLVNLSIGEKKRDFGERLCVTELERRLVKEKELQAARAELLALRPQFNKGGILSAANNILLKQKALVLASKIANLEEESLPQYMQIYIPWPDHFAHFKGPFGDEILSPTGEYSRLDFWVGQIEKVYRDAGVYDRTLFAMAGDHGLGPVYRLLNPEVEVFDKVGGFKVRKISSDEGEGPKMTHPRNYPSNKGYDVIVASTAGGNYMMDFFKDQGAGWTEQPVYQDLTRLKLLGGGEKDVVELLASELSESLDYLAVRETPTGVDGGVTRLVTTRDQKRVSALIHRQKNRIFYEQVSGVDLLQIRNRTPYRRPLLSVYQKTVDALYEKCVVRAQKADSASWCDEAEWRVLTSVSERIDSVVQLAHLYDSDLPGTVNLFPKRGMGYNTKVPGRHAGETFHEKDAFVGFWGNVTHKQGGRLVSIENGSVAPTIYEYLTGRDPSVEKGWGYRSFAPKLIDVSRVK